MIYFNHIGRPKEKMIHKECHAMNNDHTGN